jgi:hypothetical protein
MTWQGRLHGARNAASTGALDRKTSSAKLVSLTGTGGIGSSSAFMILFLY